MNRGLQCAGLLVFCLSAFGREKATAPAPLAPLPSPEQLAWQDGSLALFVRIGVHTFTGDDQGSGQEDPKRFNPAKLDARQWAQVARDCGAKRLVLQVKGHDGFCLWPTPTTDYSVRHSAWRDGRGDVVREFVDACKDAGLETGFYLSCEDRHDPAYGSAKYNRVYLDQLTELLTTYGPWSEVRFDYTGGEGAGAYGSIGLDPKQRRQSYDWENYFATVKKLQPRAIVVSETGPGARWNGNNNGHSGDPNWAVFDPASLPGPEPTDPKQLRVLNAGDPRGGVWLPAECCVTLRPRWSWHADDDAQLMPPDRLLNTYCKSVGRGNVLLLNVPLNADGLIPAADAQRLRELHGAVEKLFARDLAENKPCTASNVRGDDPAFAAANAIDGRGETFWSTDDAVTNDCWLEVDLGEPTLFDTAALRENISLGQRVAAYRLEIWTDGQWKLAVHGTTIGHFKVERFKPVTARKVRLVIESSRACPAISGFALFREKP